MEVTDRYPKHSLQQCQINKICEKFNSAGARCYCCKHFVLCRSVKLLVDVVLIEIFQFFSQKIAATKVEMTEETKNLSYSVA